MVAKHAPEFLLPNTTGSHNALEVTCLFHWGYLQMSALGMKFH